MTTTEPPLSAPPASSQALPADREPAVTVSALLAAITGNQRKLAHVLTAMSEHLTVMSEHLTVLSQAVEAQLELIGRAAAASSVPTGTRDDRPSAGCRSTQPWICTKDDCPGCFNAHCWVVDELTCRNGCDVAPRRPGIPTNGDSDG